MTLVPDFEFGLWNAWIIVAGFLLAAFLPFTVGGEKADARMEGEPGFGEAGVGVRVAIIVTHLILMPLTLIYSFFVPLERGGWWLVAGLSLCAAGIVAAAAATMTFVTAPLDRPMTTGVYAVSRHPMYAATFLVYAGVGLAGTSWIFLLCALLAIGAYRLGVPEEERNMKAKYGSAYDAYLQRTPRWFGLRKGRADIS